MGTYMSRTRGILTIAVALGVMLGASPAGVSAAGPETGGGGDAGFLDFIRRLLSDDESVRPASASQTAGACNVYPIALHTSNVAGAAIGSTIVDIWNGTQPGNFGWLGWNGRVSEPELEANLRPPGRFHLFHNPFNPTDTTLNPGDWIYGAPGVKNSIGIREALDILKTMDIVVPVWDASVGWGRNAVYRAASFAQVRITDYSLPGQNRISAIYKGPIECGQVAQPDPILVGCKPALVVNPGDTFQIRNYFRYAVPELWGSAVDWSQARFTYTEGGAPATPDAGCTASTSCVTAPRATTTT
jgi:hypothetical protein